MVSSTLCPVVHILGSQNVYGRAAGTSDYYWPWAVFFFLSSLFCHLFCVQHYLVRGKAQKTRQFCPCLCNSSLKPRFLVFGLKGALLGCKWTCLKLRIKRKILKLRVALPTPEIRSRLHRYPWYVVNRIKAKMSV